MALNNDQFIEEQNIFLNFKAKDSIEALELISDSLYESNIVKESFKNAIIEREKHFSTGLQGSTYGIAIPHTDAEHVIRESVAVAVLEQPVSFTHMGTENQQVPVEIIFTLAIKEPENQLVMLQKLMELIQNDEVLKTIRNSDNKKEVAEVLNHEL